MAAKEKIDRRQGKTIRINDVKMYYEDHGKGPTLILLHGGGDSHAIWNDHLPYLTRSFRVITPDSRGHGRTDNPLGALSYRQMADDFAAFIEALKLEKPMICGWSDGANIAFEIGVRYPALAGSLILCGLYTHPSAHYRRSLQKLGFRDPGIVDYARIEKIDPGLIREMQEKHAYVYGQEYWKTLWLQLSILFLTPPNYYVLDYRKITAPTLVLTGDRDQFLPVGEHITTFHRIPHAELAVVPGSDHFFPMNHTIFDEIITSFWQRHHPQPSKP